MTRITPEQAVAIAKDYSEAIFVQQQMIAAKNIPALAAEIVLLTAKRDEAFIAGAEAMRTAASMVAAFTVIREDGKSSAPNEIAKIDPRTLPGASP